jgi:hypothetical protein
MKKYVSGIIGLIFILSSILSAQPKSKPYDYPIKPGTEEWKKFRSLHEMEQGCQIPDSLLHLMTTSDLLETCLNYPLYLNVTAYNIPQQGFENVMRGFNGLQELLKRSDLGTVCIEEYITMEPDRIIEKNQSPFQYFYIEILLAQDTIINNLSKNDRIKLLEESYKMWKHSWNRSFGNTGSLCVMGKILVKENYEPFISAVKLLNLQGFLKSGGGMSGTPVIQLIIDHVEVYLFDK